MRSDTSTPPIPIALRRRAAVYVLVHSFLFRLTACADAGKGRVFPLQAWCGLEGG